MKRNNNVTAAMVIFGIIVALVTKVLFCLYTISEWGGAIEADCPYYVTHSFQFFKMEFMAGGLFPICLSAGIAAVLGIVSTPANNKRSFFYYAALATLIVCLMSVVQSSHIINRWWDGYIINAKRVERFNDYVNLIKIIVLDCLSALIGVIIISSGLMTAIHHLMNRKKAMLN